MEKKEDLKKKLDFFKLKENDIIGKNFNPPVRYSVENQKYSKKELDYINRYKKNYKKQYKKTQEVEKSYWKDDNLLRFIQGSDFNLKQTEKNIDNHIKWRKQTIFNPNYFENTDNLLKKGLLYMCGRDNRYRPIVVIDTKKIIDSDINGEDLIKMFLRFCLTGINEYMIYGKIENFVVIIDFKNVSTFNLPINKFRMIGKIFESNLRNRMYRIFVVNAPWTVSVIFFFAKSFNENSRKKLVVSRQNNPEEMKFINKNQIEKKFGGVKKEFDVFWPIQETDLEPEKIFKDEEDLKNYTSDIKEIDNKEINNDIKKKEEEENIKIENN